MTERPSRKQQSRRCFPVLLALSLVSGAGCVASVPSQGHAVSSGQEAASPAAAAPEASEDQDAFSSQSSPVEPGFEPGFTHCCGDFNYVMQVDCSERLLRCYQNKSSGWHQTYGRNCKSALGSGCYERGCLSVCD